MIPIGMV
jgi:hypothetical protein